MTEKEKKAGPPVGNKNAAKDEGRDSRLNALACTGWQKAGWVKAAAASGQKLPEWVRDCLDAAAKKAGVKI
jgi:hypothetical protein